MKLTRWFPGIVFLIVASFASLADAPSGGSGSRVAVRGPWVVPTYLADQEFYTASGTFRDPERSQQVYGAAYFGKRPILIRAIVWRPSPNYGSAFSTTISNIQVNLSTTSAKEDQLSPVFADNVGEDDKVVFSGALKFSSRFLNGPGGTKQFDMMIPLRHPFRYDPTKGNLLVDIRNFSGSTVATFTDAYGTGGDGCSRAVALDPNSTTAGFTDTAVDPLKIIFTPAR